MVKVFPEPVTPSKVWPASPSPSPAINCLDGLGLVARGLEVGDKLEFTCHEISGHERISVSYWVLESHEPRQERRFEN